jgi:hypothetical protein
LDREILRALAGEIAQIASLDRQRETAKLYRSLNARRMIRPVVLLDELPWNQLNADGELTLRCEDETLRAVEDGMRKLLYKWNHCPGDMIVEPFWRCARAIHVGRMGPEVKEETLALDDGNNIVSHAYEDQFPDMASLDKLHMPEIYEDQHESERRLTLLDGIFGDILPVKPSGISHAGHLSPWDDMSSWRGVTPLLMDLYDEPEKMHAYMRRYTDIRLRMLKEMEDQRLIEANVPILHCTAGLTEEDDIPSAMDGVPTRKNIWGRGAAQIFASVSPAMHEEFEINYMKEFFAGFPAVYYGCCEPLHNKIDIVRKIPNVRKISITPWADVRVAAERMGGDFVMARKPNPAMVTTPALDEEALRRDILETLTVCRENNTPVEFTLKDISSVAYHPANLARWEKVAMETVRNF